MKKVLLLLCILMLAALPLSVNAETAGDEAQPEKAEENLGPVLVTVGSEEVRENHPWLQAQLIDYSSIQAEGVEPDPQQDRYDAMSRTVAGLVRKHGAESRGIACTPEDIERAMAEISLEKDIFFDIHAVYGPDASETEREAAVEEAMEQISRSIPGMTWELYEALAEMSAYFNKAVEIAFAGYEVTEEEMEAYRRDDAETREYLELLKQYYPVDEDKIIRESILWDKAEAGFRNMISLWETECEITWTEEGQAWKAQ